METPRFTPPFATPRKKRPLLLFVGALVLCLVVLSATIAHSSRPAVEPLHSEEQKAQEEARVRILAQAHVRAILRGDDHALLVGYHENARVFFVRGTEEMRWSGIEDVRTAWMGSSRKGTLQAKEGLLSIIRSVVPTLLEDEVRLQKSEKGEYSVKSVLRAAQGPAVEITDELRFSMDSRILEERIVMTVQEVSTLPLSGEEALLPAQ